MEYKILNKVDYPIDLKKLDNEELKFTLFSSMLISILPIGIPGLNKPPVPDV